MRITLIGNMAYFESFGYVPDTDCKVEIDIEGIDFTEYRLSARVNDLPSRICSEYITVPKNEFKKETLKIDITVTHKGTGKNQIFPMDPVPLSRATLIGKDILETYPVSFKLLKKDMKNALESIALLKKGIVEMSRRGEIL